MSETGFEFPGTLDLSTADTRGSAMPAGTYDAIVFEVTPVKIESDGGKLPIDTPGINVQYKVDGGEYDNRRAFQRFYFPAEDTDYDADKRKKLLGMFARFLTAIGYGEEEVKSGSFQLDIEDMIGRECRITVGYDAEYESNPVKSVRPRQADSGGSGGLL